MRTSAKESQPDKMDHCPHGWMRADNLYTRGQYEMQKTPKKQKE